MRKSLINHGLLAVLLCFQTMTLLPLNASAYTIGDIMEADPGQRKTFTISPKEYSKVEDSVEVPNMPRIRSQDALGVCYAFAATTVMQHALCQKNGWDCQNLKPEQEISDAGMMMDTVESDGTRSYSGLGSSGRSAVDTFQRYPIITNKCAPFDIIVNKSDDPAISAQLQNEMWNRLLEAQEQTWKFKMDRCKECAKDVMTTAMAKEVNDGNLKFDSKRTEFEKLRGFVNQAGEKMIEQILVPERCKKEDTMEQTLGSMKWKSVPPTESDDLSEEYKISAAREHFKTKKTPMMLGVGIIDACPDKPKKLCRLGGHEIVVSGYRKACNAKGKCIEELKVHNSWGQRWQEQNNNGWIDARSMINAGTGRFDAYE